MLVSDAKLNELSATVTPGPWYISKNQCYHDGAVRDGYTVAGARDIPDYEMIAFCEYDAEAMSLAPMLIRDLIDAKMRIADLEWKLENKL